MALGNINPGEIVTVEDFMDSMVHFMTPSEPNYKEKVTLVFSDGSRMIVRKDTLMWYENNHGGDDGKTLAWRGHEFQVVAGKLKVGDAIPVLTQGQGVSGTEWWDGLKKTARIEVKKVIDPADNTTFEGIGNHKFEAKMPVPGELISVQDIKNLLVSTGTKMYEYTQVEVFEWYNPAWTNNEHVIPAWSDPGPDISKYAGDGWSIARNWRFKRLTNPITTSEGLYKNVVTDNKIHEDQLISIYHIQRLMSKMYVTNNNRGFDYIHHLTCHNNCHHNCHCARW